MSRPQKLNRYPELREPLARARARGAALDEVLEFVREWFASQRARGDGGSLDGRDSGSRASTRSVSASSARVRPPRS